MFNFRNYSEKLILTFPRRNNMKIIPHHIHKKMIAEIISEQIIIMNAEDALELLGSLYYQDFEGVILHEKNISPDFFDLTSGMAGEILQKFSNYRVLFSLVGDFQKYPSQSLKDFIYESNKAGKISFVNSVDEAIQKLLDC